MPGLFSIAYADLRSRGLTTALTVIAVALGAAVIVATFATNVAVEDSMTRAAKAVVGDTDLVVEAVDEQGFASSAILAVGGLQGVSVVAPQVHKRVFFTTPTAHGFVQVIGVDPTLEREIRGISVAEGQWLQQTDRDVLAIGRQWAATYGAIVGGTVDLITVDGRRTFRVVGLLDDVDLSQRGTSGTIRMPLAGAQAAFGFGDRVQTLGIRLTDPVAADTVKAKLESVLPYLFVARDSGQVLDDLRASIRDFEVALSLFGIVALLAGAVLVFNTLSLTVVERRQQIGLLRAVGAPIGLVVRLMLAQGLLLGIAGAIVGVVGGQILAAALVLIVGRTQGIGIGGFPFSPVGAVASAVLAILVTLLAAAVPALRAGRTSPLAAMRATRASTGPSRGGARLTVVTLLVIALAAFVLVPLGGDAVATAKAVALLVLLPLGMYASQLLIPLFAGIAAVIVRRFARGPGLLAERTIRRERGQTTLTVASFVIALGLIVALSGAASSFTTAGATWAQTLFPGHAVVVSPVDQPLDLAGEFEPIKGVESASAVSQVQVVWQGVRLTAVGVDPPRYLEAFQFAEGERTAAFKRMNQGDGALITVALAREMDLHVGDPFPLTGRGLAGDFVVAGVIVHSLPTADNFGAVVLPREAMQILFGVNTFRFLVISAAPDADLAALDRDVATTAESFGMQARTQADLARSVGDSVGALFAPLAGLVAIGVIVGALGLANTMVLTIALRRREIGILRAVGMGTGRVRRLAMAEAAILGFVGALLGVILGAFLTLVLVTLSRTADLDPQFAFSLPVAVGVIVAGVLVAIVAALYPAGIAARMEIVKSIREG
jgi:putative ABC transport system permease protein